MMNNIIKYNGKDIKNYIAGDLRINIFNMKHNTLISISSEQSGSLYDLRFEGDDVEQVNKMLSHLKIKIEIIKHHKHKIKIEEMECDDEHLEILKHNNVKFSIIK